MNTNIFTNMNTNINTYTDTNTNANTNTNTIQYNYKYKYKYKTLCINIDHYYFDQLAQQTASKQLSHHPVSMGHLYVLTRLATPHVGKKTKETPRG